MSTVLINDTVKKYLLKRPTAARKKIRDKFEYLDVWLKKAMSMYTSL